MALIFTPETSVETTVTPTSFDDFLNVLSKLRLAPVRVDIDIDDRIVTIDGSEVKLCAKEFDLLAHLATNSDRAVSREELFETVWFGAGLDQSSRTVDAHIRRLRGKLIDEDLISTVRGEGYRFNSVAQVRILSTPAHTLAA